MKKIKLLVTTAFISALLSACSTTKNIVNVEEFVSGSCVFQETTQPAPDWFCAPDALFPTGSWFQKGEGHSSLGDSNLQYTVAVQNARIELGRRAQLTVEDNFKQVTTTEGMANAQHAEITRTILSTVTTAIALPPTYKAQETYDSNGNLHVLIRVDEQKMMEKIKEKENELMRLFSADLKRKQQQPIVESPNQKLNTADI